MELCGPKNLSSFIKSRPNKKIDEREAHDIFKQVCEALNHLHKKGISHLDLKLTNIMIDDRGRVKLIDFGFSHNRDEELERTCGTPSYMSPELIEKRNFRGRTSDIWALGVCIYRAMTGEYPFGRKIFLLSSF